MDETSAGNYGKNIASRSHVTDSQSSRRHQEKIRTSIGLDNTKLIISGASALSKSTIEWFQKIGINIRETYGMTEALAIVIIQPKNDVRIDSTGKCFEEGEIKIDPETDEILVKNSWMFAEYYNEPELTKASFDKAGFYKTGDTGDLDSDGFLKIKGMVTADNRLDNGKEASDWAECKRNGELLADEALRIIADAEIQENSNIFLHK